MKALFAGSFDPPTLGHWGVIERACPLFEKLYIVIATNTTKTPMLEVETRKKIFEELIAASKFKKQCEVVTAPGLVANLSTELKAEYLVRGVRGTADLERELPMSVANELLKKDLKTILVPSTTEYSFVSSTLVREIYTLGGDIRPFVPDAVLKYLKKGKKK